MFILIKILQKIASPLGLGLIGFLLLLLYRNARNNLVLVLAYFCWVTLLVFSIPVISDALLGSLEEQHSGTQLGEYPDTDAIVVLGGTTEPQWGKSYLAEELAGSRLLTAARLYKLGKAPKVIVTSGIVYQTESGSLRTEAYDMREILVEMGVPRSSIVIEDKARNTKENASYSRALLPENEAEILLVTSAYHLQRAERWFLHNDFVVHPVPAGRSVRPREASILSYVPSATALDRSSAALKEYLGLLQIVLDGEGSK